MTRIGNNPEIWVVLAGLVVTLFSVTFVHGQETGAQPESPKRRVLILGDSISMGYTPHVAELLKEEALVVRPNRDGRPENCAGTDNGLLHLDRWLELEGGQWDVIHFNFGLHDLKHVDAGTGKNSNNASDPYQTGPDEYEKQLRQIMEKLVATEAQLILCTTTPVPEGELKPLREPAMAPVYNSIAKRLAAELSTPQRPIRVNDLFAFAQSRLGEIQQPANVHFTKEGSKQLAAEVARVIRQTWQAPKTD